MSEVPLYTAAVLVVMKVSSLNYSSTVSCTGGCAPLLDFPDHSTEYTPPEVPTVGLLLGA